MSRLVAIFAIERTMTDCRTGNDPIGSASNWRSRRRRHHPKHRDSRAAAHVRTTTSLDAPGCVHQGVRWTDERSEQCLLTSRTATRNLRDSLTPTALTPIGC